MIGFQVQAEKYLLLQTRGEQERLKSQIVQSPQKLQVILKSGRCTMISSLRILLTSNLTHRSFSQWQGDNNVADILHLRR